MVIVLIHWRIKPDRVDEFKAWWTSKEADIVDRVGLAGEFLSKPVPLEELQRETPRDHQVFQVADLAPAADEAPYTSFVNVGLWQSWDVFYDQVGRNFNDTGPKKEFEQCPRTRTILSPQNWRIGKCQLPTLDRLD